MTTYSGFWQDLYPMMRGLLLQVSKERSESLDYFSYDSLLSMKHSILICDVTSQPFRSRKVLAHISAEYFIKHHPTTARVELYYRMKYA
jgi:hypothetical protein